MKFISLASPCDIFYLYLGGKRVHVGKDITRDSPKGPLFQDFER